MATFRERFNNIKRFLSRDLWFAEPGEDTGLRAFLQRQLRFVVAVVQGFAADRCMLRASALTYTTLLSIVPLLALMFSVLKGFGIQNTLEPLILKNLAAGAEDVVGQIIRYIDNTNVARLGIVGLAALIFTVLTLLSNVGLAALIFTVLTLLSNIEKSFNHIWGVDETRPWLRRFSDYFSVVTIGPIFLLAAISMTSSLASIELVTHLRENTYLGPLVLLLFKAIPFVGMWIAFTVLYIFMPNTRVNYSAALVGGVLGGTFWQLAQWGYIHFQVGVGRYNAIYGTMAALPILMVWIYVSWLIVLLGVEMAYAWQNLRLTPGDIRGTEINFASREQVALTTMLVVAEAFVRGEPPLDLQQVSTRLNLTAHLAQDILRQLTRLGFLREVKGSRNGHDAYQPGRSPEGLRIHDLLQGLQKDGIEYARLHRIPEREVARELGALRRSAERDALAGLSLQDLVDRVAGGGDGANAQSAAEKVLRENPPSSKTA